MLKIENLTVRYGEMEIVEDVSFEVADGRWMMIVGPNGAGKSTVVNAAAQGVPYTGRVLVDGRDARRMRPGELARRMGVLMQSHSVGYAFSVEEIVRMGRYAYSGALGKGDGESEERIAEALEWTGLTGLRERAVTRLSGGEVQRVFLAQLFAQDPGMLVLDEPTNHLDLVYQRQVFELIEGWRKRTGRAVMSVVHDLSLARAYGTEAVLLDGGRVAAAGDVREVLTGERLDQVYGMDVGAWMRKMLEQWQ